MAEKKTQNCSEILINNVPPKRRTNNMSILSKVLKSQTTSIQHRACQDVKKKQSSGGIRMFLIKTLIAGGAVYLTACLGVWGEAEESVKISSKIKQAVTKFDNENSISSNMHHNMNKTKEFFKEHLETIPNDIKVFYEKSEKCITDFFKGKKS
ncbi:uncharacterized protein LOC129942162 isoform X2 [Eupeodes corollae]|uniref:uncharacterized protein LOC129942162 isoform X2 n=1 Tax=Eupeodes corollae TaxID=290404 RepID=UPI00249307BE|nr:uncharacterized protein LOC129942162 isoform X2 [Eupeodes corollae]